MTGYSVVVSRPRLSAPPLRMWLVLFAFAVVLTLATVANQHHDQRPVAPSAPTSTVCVEDDPSGCWRCAEMGNRICGPTPGHPTERTAP